MKQLGLFCHLKYMFRHTEARCKFSRCWWNWVCADAQLTFSTVNNVNISERFTYSNSRRCQAYLKAISTAHLPI